MSRISQDFINNVGYLYEEINVQQNDFLNEESENYDAEMSHMVEDILSTVSVSMIYEGYSASAVIGFLADSSEQDILEKYLTFDETTLLENTISEEYVQEQLEIFDYCIDEGLGDKLVSGALKLAGRIASKPARSAVSKKLASSTNPEKTRAAIQKLAQREARKGNVGGYSKTQSPIDGGKPMSAKQSAELLTKAKIGQVTQKVKDIASKAKPVLQKVGKGTAVFGLGAAGGYMGAKMAGAGAPTSSNAPTPPVSPSAPTEPVRTPSAPNTPSRVPGAPSKPRANSAAAPAKPKSSAAKPGETPMQQWARLNPNLAAKVKPGQSGYEEISQTRVKPGPYEKKDQTPTTGPQSAQIDTKQVEDAIKAAQEKQKKQMEQQKNAMTTKESYEPYDIVLDYLFSRGHADTLDEANYIMMEMDEKAIGMIIEEYKNYFNS